MDSPPNFRISPGNPSGPTDLFLQIFAYLFLIILVSIIMVSPGLANFISGMLRSQKNTDAKQEFRMFHILIELRPAGDFIS